MTALEILELMSRAPDPVQIDTEIERIDGTAVAGDVDPALARRYVYGEVLRRTLCPSRPCLR